MRLRAYISAIVLAIGVQVYSQETLVTESTDTLSIETTSPTDFNITYPYFTPLSLLEYGLSMQSAASAYQGLSVSPNYYDKSAVNPLPANLSGYVTQQSLPGLMGIESGALSYTLSAGNISFTPGVFVNKYGYYGGLTTSLGFGGELTFKLSDRFSITAFGAYHRNSWAANPAVMANMMSSRFGGYATWDVNDSWKLNVGAQRVYNSATGSWQTIPIVMPSFKINGKDAIGIDIGGLLYQVIDYHLNKNSKRPPYPVMAPPDRPQITFGPRE